MTWGVGRHGMMSGSCEEAKPRQRELRVCNYRTMECISGASRDGIFVHTQSVEQRVNRQRSYCKFEINHHGI